MNARRSGDRASPRLAPLLVVGTTALALAGAGPTVIRSEVTPLPIDAPVARVPRPPASAELSKRGLELFAAQCAACHGARGGGDGVAAYAAAPRPRNFKKGIFKLHSNENGSLPTDEDLFDSITRGLPGSAMPSFDHLSLADRWALVEAVKELTVFEGKDDDDKDFQIVFFKERPPLPPLPTGEPRAVTPQVLALGRAAYLKLDCNKCHGNDGDGTGPSSTELKDDWGEPIWPRNFQHGHYRGGASVRDLVVRIQTGLMGTPMAAFGGGQLTEDERWAIGHYLASFKRGEPKPVPLAGGVIDAVETEATIPSDLRQARFWMDAPLTEVALKGDGPSKVRVSVQRDAKNLSLLVAWDDPIARARPAAPEDFLDAVTVELAKDSLANAWEWRGEWQRDAATRPSGAFEERGPSATTLTGAAVWAEGEWRVHFVRPLAAGEKGVALQGTVDVKSIRIDDRSATGARSSKSEPFALRIR